MDLILLEKYETLALEYFYDLKKRTPKTPPESLIYRMNEVSKYKDLLEQNVSMTLLSSRSMLESVNKRKEGTRAGDVKSKVMAEIYSCGIKP